MMTWSTDSLIISMLGGAMLGQAVYFAHKSFKSVLGCSGIFNTSVHRLIQKLTSILTSSGAGSTSRFDELYSPWPLAPFLGLVTGFLLPQFAAFLTSLAFDSKSMGDIYNIITVRDSLSFSSAFSPSLIGAALAVGLGTKLANGCTSGHMLIGLSRLSKRSIVASVVFSITAITTAISLNRIPSDYSFQSSHPAHLPQLNLPMITFLLSLLLVPAFSIHYFSSASRRLSMSLWSQRMIVGWLIGALFTCGLIVSGMSDSSRVLRFFAFPVPFAPFSSLSAQGISWDPSMIMVMIGALTPIVTSWWYLGDRHLKAGLLSAYDRPSAESVGETWNNSNTTANNNIPRPIDWRLIIGSVIFGIGWGLSGICPGPLMANMVSGPLKYLLFGVSMALGSELATYLS